MADDPALDAELERSRETSVRLLESLAQKIRTTRAMRRASSDLLEHSIKGAAAQVTRLVRRRPGISIMVAVAAGFLVGRAFRSR
jgi:ElaB/YqjD/DUF883 family membrane-anchored ribosome-binding protein